MRKKYWLAAAVLALAVQTAGCSGTEAAQETAQTQESQTEAETEAAAEETEAAAEETEAAEEETEAAAEETEAAEDETEAAAESQESGEAETEAESSAQAAETAAAADLAGFVFQSGGVAIGMNQEAAPVVAALGGWDNYIETESCAFQGLDKIYSYTGFDLYTYPKDDVDYVNSIYFTSDAVSTPEGIRIGSSLDEVLAAYGDQYTEEFGVYTYTKDQSTLSFIVTDGIVESVEYTAITE